MTSQTAKHSPDPGPAPSCLRIGVDLGGTKTEIVALDSDGKELYRRRVRTVSGSYERTVETIRELVAGAEHALGRTGTVGVGIPGTIAARTGLVKNANSTWLNGRPLQADLTRVLGRPVVCANDANCFATSEAVDGAAQGSAVVFGVILGTGCGGGLLINQQTHHGPNGLAGEWGHAPLPWPTPEESPGPACYCGRNGCLETWISGPAFARDYRENGGTATRGQEIIEKMRLGEAAAEEAYARLRSRLARGLAMVVDILDPDVIVLGGGLSNIDELYDGTLEAEIAVWTFGGGTHTPVRRNLHGDSSGVRGAAWLPGPAQLW